MALFDFVGDTAHTFSDFHAPDGSTLVLHPDDVVEFPEDLHLAVLEPHEGPVPGHVVEAVPVKRERLPVEDEPAPGPPPGAVADPEPATPPAPAAKATKAAKTTAPAPPAAS